jgi:hypothetical protein
MARELEVFAGREESPGHDIRVAPAGSTRNNIFPQTQVAFCFA